MAKLTVSGLLACVAFVIACDGNDDASSAEKGPVPLPTGPGMGVQEFCETWAERITPWCDWESSCCGRSSRMSVPFVGSCGRHDVESCLSSVTDMLSTGAQWDGTNADACINAGTTGTPPSACDGAHMAEYAFRTAFFTMVPDSYPECRGLLSNPEGTQGTRCDFDWQCQAELTCNAPVGHGGGEYECVERRSVGEPCEYSLDCRDGLVCFETDSLAGTCSEGAVGATCEADEHCTGGLRCGAGCVVPGELGAPCSAEAPCKAGLRCGSEGCSEPMADGNPCTQHDDCVGECDFGNDICVSVCGGAFF
jgi:hypothetical protein